MKSLWIGCLILISLTQAQTGIYYVRSIHHLLTDGVLDGKTIVDFDDANGTHVGTSVITRQYPFSTATGKITSPQNNFSFDGTQRGSKWLKFLSDMEDALIQKSRVELDLSFGSLDPDCGHSICVTNPLTYKILP